jgi:uncharacterized protein
MAKRRDNEPSALRTGLVHAALSLGVFGTLGGALGAGVHFTGDPDEASPRARLALFDTPEGDTELALKDRLRPDGGAVGAVANAAFQIPGAEPDFGIDYVEAPTLIANLETVSEEGSAEPVRGIRINGKMIKPGESFGEMTAIVSLPDVAPAGLSEKVNGLTLPTVSPDGRMPAEVYARPFANPKNKPVVSLIVGGLGINAGHTKTAIDELPPEVTLSFAPDAARLQYWIGKARAAGHEVLIEVPMEATDYGRMKMHPMTLLASDSEAVNDERLEQILSRATGYFGVINYQGSKFAGDSKASRPVIAAIGRRGLALIEDGSLPGAGFGSMPDEMNLRYARANLPVDSKLTAVDITSQLMELEAVASEKGAALGSAYAFPLTIEMAKTWCAELPAKGLVLAPASALAGVTAAEAPRAKPRDAKSTRVKTGSLAKPHVNPAG